tara:strand:- start:688 stop:873 length:186 start_codon:yes stop_codon:yes gene_type:complete
MKKAEQAWRKSCPDEAQGLVTKRSKRKYARLTKSLVEKKIMEAQGFKTKMIGGYIIGTKFE